MKRISLFLLPMAFVSLAFALMTTFAQTEKPEKVSLHMTPKPDQTAKLRMTTEMDVEMSFEGEVSAAQAALNPMKMQMKSITAFTQKTGPLDKQNRFVMELVYDEVNFEMMMNGNAIPIGAEMAELKGKKIKVTMDQQGNIFDVQSPKEIGMDTAAFKELLKSLYGALPPESMAVGETATVPLSMVLPLPGTSGPLNLQGSSKIKLVAVEKEGTSRLAKLETVSEARMTSVLGFPSPNGPAKMKLDFSMTGGSPSSVNLDKGTVKTNDLTMTLQGKMSPATESADAKLPIMVLKGTVKTIVASVN